MEVRYDIVYLKSVVKTHIPALSSDIKTLIKRIIEERLAVDPIRFGKPLQYSLKGYRSLRVGDYRIVYTIEEYTVTVVAIKHRKDVYVGVVYVGVY
jgi:mRNA interferase RelE/StbE